MFGKWNSCSAVTRGRIRAGAGAGHFTNRHAPRFAFFACVSNSASRALLANADAAKRPTDRPSACSSPWSPRWHSRHSPTTPATRAPPRMAACARYARAMFVRTRGAHDRRNRLATWCEVDSFAPRFERMMNPAQTTSLPPAGDAPSHLWRGAVKMQFRNRHMATRT